MMIMIISTSPKVNDLQHHHDHRLYILYIYHSLLWQLSTIHRVSDEEGIYVAMVVRIIR